MSTYFIRTSSSRCSTLIDQNTLDTRLIDCIFSSRGLSKIHAYLQILDANATNIKLIRRINLFRMPVSK